MRFPLGKKGLVATAALVGAAVYWRVRHNRLEQEREWEEELRSATEEGVSAARAALAPDERPA